MQNTFSIPRLYIVIWGSSQAIQQSQKQEDSVGISVVSRQMVKIVAGSVLFQALGRISLSHAVDPLEGVGITSRTTGGAIQDWKLRARHTYKPAKIQQTINSIFCDKYVHVFWV